MGLYGIGCPGGIWRVNADGSGDAPTIQAAIDLASDGDTVLCGAGTYTGDGNRDLDFKGKNILVLSQDGAEATTIDCQGSPGNPHFAFFFHSGEDSSSTIDGFTITNAYSEEQGAITVTGAAPRIRNCIISDNDGCGIYCYPNLPWDDWLRIENCTIVNNTVSGVRSHGGRTRISGSDISHNGYNGVFIEWGGQVEMIESVANGNGNIGLHMFTMDEYFHVANCTFFNNRVGLFWDFNFPKVSPETGASSVDDTSRVTNSIFAYNRETGVVLYFSQPMQQILCSNSYGNGGEDWDAGVFQAGDEWDNFSADPMFCDTASGDFSVSENSPCAPAYSPCGLLVGAYDVSCVTTGVADGANEPLPSTFSLRQNYPNPFNPSTQILFELPARANVKLEIFNITGQRIAALLEGQVSAGKHSVLWDASDCASGVYLYRIQAGDFVDSKKMLLLK